MNNNRVCPVEKAKMLDSWFRKLFQNPKKILRKYIKKGMTVLDFGCGSGFHTIEIAKLLDSTGKVIAVDFQEGMLNIVKNKMQGTELEKIVQLHKCEQDSIGISERVDFILAFYVVHEVPNQDKLFQEFKSILNQNGSILIVEPKFHVNKIEFGQMVNKLKNIGFKEIEQPKIFKSRAIHLSF